MTQAQSKVDQCVEDLCSQGCDRVSGYIVALKAGQEFPRVAGLCMEERQQVLECLVAIMDVYADRPDC